MSTPFPLELDVQYCPVLNFAMEQNDVPFVRSVSIANLGAEPVGPCVLRVTTSPESTLPLEIRLPSLPAGETLELGTERVNPRILRDPLVRLEERERGELHLVVLGETGTEDLHQVLPFDLLAYNEWMGVGQLREILGAFVMPNHPTVETLMPAIVERLCERTTQTTLDGYQSKDRDYVREQAAAVYEALARQGLSYASPPPSFEQTGQKIRTPDQIQATGVATCLDLAVLLAAMLEHVGLAPFLLLKEGHAWVAVWLSDQSFDEAVVPSAVAMRTRCALGEVLAFEATGVACSPPLPFAEACARGLDHLRQVSSFHYALDVRMARRMGIRPMPARLRGDVTVLPSAPQAALPEPAETLPPSAPADSVQEEAEPTAEDQKLSRLERWKRHLLDLSRRNRLLNFRDSRRGILLACPDLASVEDALAAGDEFTVLPCPKQLADDPRDAELHRQRTGDDLIDTFLLQQMKEKRLHSTHAPAELEKRMREMDRAARLSLEESGANTMFLALGFLRWFEEGRDPAANLAPIILLPMRIDRRSVRRGFRVRMVDEEARINVTLLRKLEADFEISISGLDPLPTDDSGLDVPTIIRRVREAVKHKDNWEVVEDATLAIFTFTKFLMWADLEVNTATLMQSPIVHHLVETPAEPFPAEPLAPVELDRIDPAELMVPLDADSSQLQAVVAAGNGASFVLQGPPGTGKSQTITNLIAHCMASGQRVLFVSEKMAALNVVKHRLELVGLGPFCLELHSHKSTKHDFRRQLEEALNLGRFAEPDLWQRRTGQLAQRRDELNEYVRAMQTQRPFGESVLWACERWVEHRDLPDHRLELGDLDKVGPEVLDDLLAAARRLRDDAVHCELGPEHPLREVGLQEWGPGLAPRVRAATAAVSESAAELTEVAARALKPLRLGSSNWSRFMLEYGAELIELLLETPAIHSELLRTPDWDETALLELLATGRRRDALRAQLGDVYGDAYGQLPLEILQDRLRRHGESGFPMGWWQGFLARRAFRKAMAVPKSRSFADLAADLAAAFELRECESAVTTSSLGPFFGPHWRDGEADWDQLARQIAWASRFRTTIRKPDFADPEDEIAARGLWVQMATENRESVLPDGALGKGFTRYLEVFRHFCDARQAVAGLLLPDPESAWSDALLPDCPGVSAQLAARWFAAQREQRAWCAWQTAKVGGCALGLHEAVRGLESGELAPTAVAGTVEKAFGRWVLEQALVEEPALKGFQGVELNRVVEEFRRIDEEVRELSCKALFARLSARLPDSGGGEERLRSSEIGRLKRFAKGGRRSIRQVFRECPNALSRLKPCVLMSPLSVAQFLGPEFPKFDLVVFDEASQMPPWEAVGAIARGESLIVVGDSKQLPPTSFFQRNAEEDEVLSEDDLEDMESILDECVACQFPSRTLTWHYRSRHESLIAFSNYHYYANRLSTFPSPDRDTTRLGVSWRPVPDGFYDTGQSRTNQAEAEAVVAEVVARLTDSAQRSHSLGVVTFSMAQQLLIEDLLEKARAEQPEIEPYFSDRVQEPVFVKNLETVQGDERDVILFSICYGPNRDGKVSMNFGPLNGKGGERRLNVAVTRARRQLLVFSTLRAEQIDLQRTQAVGVVHLKSFLKFAGEGMTGMLDSGVGEDQAVAPVALSLKQALVERGWAVESEVGSSGCRVGLAVRHPDHAESFLLGVDIESQAQGQPGTARDRNRLRDSVLRALGWRLVHLWALDWCFDQERELARIEAALAEALAEFRPPDEREGTGGNEPEPEEQEDAQEPFALLQVDLVPLEEEEQALDAGETVYQTTALAPAEGGSEAFHSPAANRSVAARILRMVENEAPLSPEFIARRVAACWGITRLSRKVVDRVFDRVPMQSVQLTESEGRQFVWWHEQEPEAYAEYRIPDPTDEFQRSAEHICPQEVANAMVANLDRHLSLAADDLVRAAAATFGFNRVGNVVKQSMQAGLDYLLASQRAVHDEGMVSLAEQD